MPRTLNVLVLGVGGNVSQGILKALALAKIPCRVIGACISSLSFGLYTVDQAYISPAANDPEFLGWLIRLCRTEKIDAILSGVEPVLTALSGHAEQIREQTGAVCIVSPPECLAIGNDKLLTSHWLRDNGFSFPTTVDASDSEGLKALMHECGAHLIAKPRFGKGGHGIFELRTPADVQWAAVKHDYVIQEYLGESQQEYTAGCFSDCEAVVRGALVMRRDLLEGTTYRAEAGAFPEVRHEAIRIAEALKPMGPSNIQLRMHGGRAVCFEINIRFSGTTPIRARLGFNDVEAALNHYVLGQPAADLPVITKGIALRYWNEAYVETEAKSELDKLGKSGEPRRFNPIIEDYGIDK